MLLFLYYILGIATVLMAIVTLICGIVKLAFYLNEN